MSSPFPLRSEPPTAHRRDLVGDGVGWGDSLIVLELQTGLICGDTYSLWLGWVSEGSEPQCGSL